MLRASDFAYQPKAGGKLVIRGGWGMFYQIPNVSYFGDSGRIQRRRDGNQRQHRRDRAGFDARESERPSLLSRAFRSLQEVRRTGPYGAFSVSQHFVDGYSMNTHLNIQYQLAQNAGR